MKSQQHCATFRSKGVAPSAKTGLITRKLAEPGATPFRISELSTVLTWAASPGEALIRPPVRFTRLGVMLVLPGTARPRDGAISPNEWRLARRGGCILYSDPANGRVGIGPEATSVPPPLPVSPAGFFFSLHPSCYPIGPAGSARSRAPPLLPALL